MSEAAKHTRGPWIAEQGINDEPERWCVVTDSTAHFLVAVIENGAPEDTLDTEAANARLIAAAPRMLELLKEAMGILARRCVSPAMQAEINAVLAEIRGKP